MWYLIAAALLWSASFGLIKGEMGVLAPAYVAVARLTVSALFFAPLLRLRRLPPRLCLQLALVGGLQYGLMYVCYINAYSYLTVYQVVLLTILTPLYVTLIDAALTRRFSASFWGATLLAVLGAYVIKGGEGWRAPAMRGILLMQASNLAFAAGQLAYRRVMGRVRVLQPETGDRTIAGLLYVGGALAAGAAWALGGQAVGSLLGWRQLGVLLYLGLLPTGIGFLLWNKGACRVNAGTLAVMNNAKIPIGIAVTALCFPALRSPFEWSLLAGGMLMLLAVALTRRASVQPK
jgi:drug/metabolite transporter (DMT)-like permease